MKLPYHCIQAFLMALSFIMIGAISQAREALPPNDDVGPLIEVMHIKNMTFRQFANMLSQGTNRKIIVSQKAGDIPINIYLEDIYAEEALEAVCQAYQCWYKKNQNTRITCIMTIEEYQSGMATQEEDLVELVTLKYVDARSVGDAAAGPVSGSDYLG